MKVVWVAPSLGGRGVTIVCEQAAKTVSLTSSHCVILLTIHNIPDNYLPPKGLRIECLGLPNDNDEVACKGFYDWVIKEKPNVILLNDVPTLDSIWPYLPDFVQVVSVLHDHAYGWVKNTIACKKALNGVVAVSEFVRNSIAERLSDFGGKLATIENGSDYPKKPDNREVRKGCLRLIFLGAIERQKGAFDLPKILKLLKKREIDFNLKIVGGESKYLRSRFHDIGVGNHVQWLGRLPRNSCFQNLANSDILLMLSRGESFGMVTTEAMSMGCVPVGYDSGGTSSIVDVSSGDLVKLADINALVDRIKSLDADRDLLLSKSVSCSNRARSKYSSKVMADKYTKFFENLTHVSSQPQRLDIKDYKKPKRRARIYAQYVPAFIRKSISSLLSVFPRLENYARRWRGI